MQLETKNIFSLMPFYRIKAQLEGTESHQSPLESLFFLIQQFQIEPKCYRISQFHVLSPTPEKSHLYQRWSRSRSGLRPEFAF